jgi:GntR family transcriptional regulator
MAPAQTPPRAVTIDFESNIPYYVQLIDIIKYLIDSGNWSAGTRIPGELELCSSYGISRTVVRQALRELKFEGIVTTGKGRGSYITQPKINESLVQKLTGFYEDMVERRLRPITQVLHQRVIPCPEGIAARLHVPGGSQVINIKRRRSVGDAPILLVTSYLPYDLCPQLATVDLANRSLYAFLESDCHLFIVRGRRFIEAVAASEEEAGLLQTAPGSPLIRLESISYLEDGRPMEYYIALHRGDRTRFEVELVRTRRHEHEVEAGSLPQSNPLI